jgi:hypothetical protein
MPVYSSSKNGVALLAYSRSKSGVAEFTLGLAEGKTRGLAYVALCRGRPRLCRSMKDVDGRDKPGHDE